MKTENELKIGNKQAAGFKVAAQSLSELVEGCPEDIQELKIMHSQKLCSMQGIKRLRQLKKVNLGSNSLTSLQQLAYLTKLTYLDVKANRIVSLEGINKCFSLLTLDASNNLIQKLSPFHDFKNSKLKTLNLSSNNIRNQQELKYLSKLNSLQEISFQKGKGKVNQMCMDTDKYLQAVGTYLPQNAQVDGQAVVEIVKKVLWEKKGDSSQMNSVEDYSEESKYQPKHSSHSGATYQGFRKTQNQRGFMETHKARELQQILALKTNLLEELKDKNQHLETTKAHQYREILKKDNQLERIYGQNNELCRQMEKKETQLSENHKRVEEVLKSLTESHRLADNKSEEIEKLRKQINELKIESAQYKAVAKDYEKKMSEMHIKTLNNVEQRTIKSEQLRRKYEHLYDENRHLVKDQEELKQRVHELTHLLREWQLKYETKVNDLQNRHNYEKGELLRESESRMAEVNQNHEFELEKMDIQMREKLKLMETQCHDLLQSAIEKYKSIKKAHDEKLRQQDKLKTALKTVVDKNRQQEGIIQQFQTMLIKLKEQMEDNHQEKDHKDKQLSLYKSKLLELQRSRQEEFQRILFEKNNLEKQVYDLIQNNKILKMDADRFTSFQREYTAMEEKLEHMSAALDAKNAMLDDKNDSIENLKLEIGNLQKSFEDKSDEVESLFKKNEKKKEKLLQFAEQTKNLEAENEQMREKLSDYQKFISEFNQLRDTLANQDTSLVQKDKYINQLIPALENCKRANILLNEELQQKNREVSREQKLLTQAQDRQRQTHTKLKSLQEEYEIKYKAIEGQRDHYKKVAVQELQNLTRKLKF